MDGGAWWGAWSLQSMGSLGVRHDCATSLWLFPSCIREGNGNPLQCSCLENPRDGGAWWAAAYGVAQSRANWSDLAPAAACPLSRWCHPTISSSVAHFASHLQSFPASGSFQMSQFFASGGQSIGVLASASALPMNIQYWSPLGWTGWISLLSKELSRVFSMKRFGVRKQEY